MTGTESVVLVHGLWMHGMAMVLMRRRIKRCGYGAVNYSYPSMRLTFAQNAERLMQFCRGLDASLLHLVGHSLGGLIILRMLQHATGLNIGRIVLAGTPFADSFAAHRLARLPGGRTVLGKSMLEWLGAPRPAGLNRYEIGVIAGSLGVGLGRVIAPDLPQPNDGVVSVDETHIPAARAHVVLKVSHSAMLVSPAVARQVCEFIGRGTFTAQLPRHE